jgi:hypothetical protein
MPIVPELETDERQPIAERVARAVTAPLQSTSNRVVAYLAAAAGAGSLAPDPFGVIVAALLVAVAWDAGRRK